MKRALVISAFCLVALPATGNAGLPDETPCLYGGQPVGAEPITLAGSTGSVCPAVADPGADVAVVQPSAPVAQPSAPAVQSPSGSASPARPAAVGQPKAKTGKKKTKRKRATRTKRRIARR